jgi:DNA replication and repair protein RecF
LLSDLKGSLQRDIQLRRTTKGPHKADWVVRTKQDDAKNILSQGQQKTAHLKIVMAHKEIMSMEGKKPLLLIDDLSAELDSQHRILINQLIEAGNGQSIITAVLEKDAGIYPSERLFHVKQGAEVRD